MGFNLKAFWLTLAAFWGAIILLLVALFVFAPVNHDTVTAPSVELAVSKAMQGTASSVQVPVDATLAEIVPKPVKRFYDDSCPNVKGCPEIIKRVYGD